MVPKTSLHQKIKILILPFLILFQHEMKIYIPFHALKFLENHIGYWKLMIHIKNAKKYEETFSPINCMKIGCTMSIRGQNH